MQKAVLIARILLGLIFTVFGLNGFFEFIPASSAPPMPEGAGNFVGALLASGYMFPLIKITEIACGVLLLIGRFVPLALTVLAPVVLNIVLFHLVLAPGLQMMMVPVLALVLGIFLAWAYRGSFVGVLKANAKPG